MKTEKEFSSTLIELGQRIYHLRILKNFVTKEISAKLHITTVAYRNIEKGNCDISFTKLLHLAEILEVDIIDLVENINKNQQVVDMKVIKFFEDKEKNKSITSRL